MMALIQRLQKFRPEDCAHLGNIEIFGARKEVCLPGCPLWWAFSKHLAPGLPRDHLDGVSISEQMAGNQAKRRW
jgi:hypothetical protein